MCCGRRGRRDAWLLAEECHHSVGDTMNTDMNVLCGWYTSFLPSSRVSRQRKRLVVCLHTVAASYISPKEVTTAHMAPWLGKMHASCAVLGCDAYCISPWI